MITLAQYVGYWSQSPDWTQDRINNARNLLDACAKLEAYAIADGVQFPINPFTQSQVSGIKYGGFRPQDCPEGRPKSAHKEGFAVDRYDPKNEIDTWCMKNRDKMTECGIYIEHPEATIHWSHWTIRAPKSKKRVFYP